MQSKAMRPTASSSGPDGTNQMAPMDVAAFGRLQLRVANLKLGTLTWRAPPSPPPPPPLPMPAVCRLPHMAILLCRRVFESMITCAD